MGALQNSQKVAIGCNCANILQHPSFGGISIRVEPMHDMQLNFRGCPCLGRRRTWNVGVLGVSRIHFHLPCRREIRFQLPAEDERSQDKSLVGRALKTIYGAKDVGSDFEDWIEGEF